MFKIFFSNKKIIVFDKTEKDFKQKYNSYYEQIGSIKEQDNLQIVCEKLKKQYCADEIILDCKIKKKFGWKYFSDEMKADINKKKSETLKKHVRTPEHCANIARVRRGRRLKWAGKHTEDSKKRIGLAKKGTKHLVGKKWMHNPITGQSSRGLVLKPGMIWGRSPEAQEYILEAIRVRKLRKSNRYR